MTSSLVRQQCRRQTQTPLNYDNVTRTEFSIYLMYCVNEIEIKSYFHVIVTKGAFLKISRKRSIFRWDALGEV